MGLADTAGHRPLAPDPALWAGLEDGALLREALRDFYAQAFADPALAPFFVDVTRDWVAQKQWSFLRSIICGDDSYFGYRPRNAHHWMVISDALFDHRERLLEASLKRAGVADRWIARIRQIDEAYRPHIVKTEPWPRKVGGSALPLDGYETLTLECGALCDRCAGELARGTPAHYHVRTGKVLCDGCPAQPGSRLNG